MVRTIEWQPLSDDYGVVGYAWDCQHCGNEHRWVVPCRDCEYQCEVCGEESYGDWVDTKRKVRKMEGYWTWLDVTKAARLFMNNPEELKSYHVRVKKESEE